MQKRLEEGRDEISHPENFSRDRSYIIEEIRKMLFVGCCCNES